VYYVIDYVPNRFSNSFMNSIYHLIDRVCCRNVDVIWNLSVRMLEGRIAGGLNPAGCAPSVIVPMGVDLSRVRPLPLEEIGRHTVVYMGALLNNKGIRLALEVMPAVRKEVPDLRFVLVGAGADEEQIRQLASDLDLADVVEFKGYIQDHEELERILCRCAIGLAPYTEDSDNYVYYTDPGKPKVYIGCGLPVVITRLPLIADEIQAKRAGLVIDYQADTLTRALLRLLRDDAFYVECRRNAIGMSRMYNWADICERALRETGYDVSRTGTTEGDGLGEDRGHVEHGV